MNKIVILITTYKRPEKLLELLQDIKKESKEYNIEILIFEDKSSANYHKTEQFLAGNFKKYAWFYSDIHYGKKDYWIIINALYNKLKNLQFNYVIQLPDDIRLTENFFTNAITIFNKIYDKSKICLNILQDNRTTKPMWTPVAQEDYSNIYKTGWVDMCFIAKRKFFKALNYIIYQVPEKWGANPTRSSGVGKQISERLYKNYHLYWVKKSLVIHGNHESVMHPLHRKKIPLVANNKKDKIIAGMASMPERETSLKLVVSSILPQVDELHVYLNNYNNIPDFLKQNKIFIYKSEDEIGDIGDVGKFYTVEKAKGYFFAMDDDIIYPFDYVITLMNKIEQYKRRYPVSLHGRIFDNLPTHSYYHGHTKTFQCFNDILIDEFAQIIGTGVLAFHTDTIKIKISDFKTTNMADIWFSKKCHKLNINLMVIAHHAGWIKDTRKYDKKYCIYSLLHKNESYQTKILNGTRWNSIPKLFEA